MQRHHRHRYRLAGFSILLFIGMAVCSRPSLAIDPVRPGDQIEVYYLGDWRPGEVLRYKSGRAIVRYKWISEREGEFALEKMRFPNDEGSWMMWSDASGKFRIEARLLKRTETHVTLQKEGGDVVDVPISGLSKSLQTKLKKIAQAAKEFVDAALVRVGDKVEYKWGSTWYPATVKEITAKGAFIEYESFTGKMKEVDAEYKGLRYPNGEGPWADWKDDTGQHEVKARYLTHDDQYVELLLENGQRTRLPRNRLDASIESELAKRAVLTRRPDEVEFSVAGVDFDNLPSQSTFGADLKAPLAKIASKPMASIGSLVDGVFEVTVPREGDIDSAFFVDGQRPLLGFVLTPKNPDSNNPISLYWIDLTSQNLLPGPSFLPGEEILDYSARQQRLITAEGMDRKGSASRYSVYRLEPGADRATPEVRWSVPKLKFSSWNRKLNARFVGDDSVLIAFGQTLTKWDLQSKRAVFVAPNSNQAIRLSPDERFVITAQGSRSAFVNTDSGHPVASLDGRDAIYTDDGSNILNKRYGTSYLVSTQHSTAAIPLTYASFFESRSRYASLIDDRWCFTGTHLWDVDNGLLTWTYATDRALGSLFMHTSGDKLLKLAEVKYVRDSTQLCVGVTTIPAQLTLSSLVDLSDDELYVLHPGVSVRVDPGISNSKIRQGVRQAIANAGWTEDPSSSVTIKASAGRGPSESRTFVQSRFGMFGQTDGTEQTVSASPWLQKLVIESNGNSVWQTGRGGMPGYVSMREGESLASAVQQCEQPNYSLFESIVFPEKLLRRKWSAGFGKTTFTQSGFVNTQVGQTP